MRISDWSSDVCSSDLADRIGRWRRSRDRRESHLGAIPGHLFGGEFARGRRGRNEQGRAGVITDERSHTKRIIFHPQMMPRVVICDPELTLGLPAKITAGTGMDAFHHCLETYCEPGFHSNADGTAGETSEEA